MTIGIIVTIWALLVVFYMVLNIIVDEIEDARQRKRRRRREGK